MQTEHAEATLAILCSPGAAWSSGGPNRFIAASRSTEARLQAAWTFSPITGHFRMIPAAAAPSPSGSRSLSDKLQRRIRDVDRDGPERDDDQPSATPRSVITVAASRRATPAPQRPIERHGEDDGPDHHDEERGKQRQDRWAGKEADSDDQLDDQVGEPRVQGLAVDVRRSRGSGLIACIAFSMWCPVRRATGEGTVMLRRQLLEKEHGCWGSVYVSMSGFGRTPCRLYTCDPSMFCGDGQLPAGAADRIVRASGDPASSHHPVLTGVHASCDLSAAPSTGRTGRRAAQSAIARPPATAALQIPQRRRRRHARKAARGGPGDRPRPVLVQTFAELVGTGAGSG